MNENDGRWYAYLGCGFMLFFIGLGMFSALAAGYIRINITI